MFRSNVGRSRLGFLRRLIGPNGFLMILALLFPTAVEAAVPADVLRKVTELIAEVSLLHDANFTVASGHRLSRSQSLRPRHSLQLARTVQQKVNTFAMLNGAETIVVGPMPTRKVTPADVLARVEVIAWVIEGVKPIVGVEEKVKPAPSRENATSNDVYSALHQLAQMIDGLGNPRTAPNDMYNIVYSIFSELDVLARNYLDSHQLGAYYITSYYTAWNADQRVERKAKSLKDIYESTFALAAALGQLIAARPELAPDGGILRPYRWRETINADHVSYALNDVLADAVAIKAAKGDQTLASSGPSASGMTPAHVYDRIQDAMGIVALLAAEG